MKVSLSGFLVFIIACAFLPNTSQAQVVQSAKRALTVDMFGDADFSPEDPEKENKKSRPKQQNKREKKQENILYSAPVYKDPNAGYGYTQKYADKFFPTYEGAVSFDEKNIPSKAIVKKGTIINLKFSDTENGFWIVSFNKQILQEISSPNPYIQIRAIKKGGTALRMEFIEKKDNKHKVTKNIKLNVYVE